MYAEDRLSTHVLILHQDLGSNITLLHPSSYVLHTPQNLEYDLFQKKQDSLQQ